MIEAERRVVQLDRLVVGIDPPRRITSLPEGLGRLGVAAGLALVPGDPRIASRIVAAETRQVEPQGVGDPSMEQPATGQARGAVDEVAHRAVGEVVAQVAV